MSVLGPRAIAAPRAVQPALPLGHAEVRWDELPHAVQADVLARWCELLNTVITPAAAGVTSQHQDGATPETRP